MQKGRRLAFDYGDVRIGVAVSDPDCILATPVETLSTRREDLWEHVFNLLAEYEPVRVYIGRPVHLSGNSSESTSKAEMFAEEFRERFDIEVMMVDERLSTVSAQRSMREAGRTTRESKGAIDQAAAVAILELALDVEKSKGKPDADE
jgi:putative Holliday junction resolvase